MTGVSIMKLLPWLSDAVAKQYKNCPRIVQTQSGKVNDGVHEVDSNLGTDMRLHAIIDYNFDPTTFYLDVTRSVEICSCETPQNVRPLKEKPKIVQKEKEAPKKETEKQRTRNDDIKEAKFFVRQKSPQRFFN